MSISKLAKRRVSHAAALLLSAAVMALQPAAAQSVSGPEILQELLDFHEMGGVLYVGAHPDDENTQLLAYLSRSRHYRTAYLSLTRGDGGQNALGGECGPELGVIRTQELLAARRLDGGRQFFTRAVDFGFSKDYRETLRIWDQEQVTADIVRVIRTFRPDVIVTRFSTVPGGTHGQNTASAMLALEAFKRAGDPQAFPDQLEELTPWQPKRILVNGRSGEAVATTLSMDINGSDPVSGETFSSIAGRSRAMRKSQKLENFAGSGGRPESFQLLGGEPATNDILDGVDTTWSRVVGGAEIGRQADGLIAHFEMTNPAASVPALLKLKRLFATLPAEPLVAEKQQQFDRILQHCLGLEVETTLPKAEVVPGEELNLHHVVSVRAGIPVIWLGTRHLASTGDFFTGPAVILKTNQPATKDETVTLPAGTPLTQPYWLRAEPAAGMFQVADARLIGRPENSPAFPLEQVFGIGGLTLTVPDEPVQTGTRRRLDVIPPVALHFVSEVQLFEPDTTYAVEIEITAARAGSAGKVTLNTPADWKISPASRPFNLVHAGDQQTLTFSLSAPKNPSRAAVTASAQLGDLTCDNDRVEIDYQHIPHLLLQPAARMTALSLDLAIRGQHVGYLPGVADRMAEALTQMGYDVTTLTGADITTNRLSNFDAVVVGPRAFNVRTDLVPKLPALFAIAKAGGTVIEQYNRPDGDLKTNQLTPYSLGLSEDRVTDATAEMTPLAMNHPALNTPNEITPADFDGWVQERGAYFPDQWDDHFTPILACHNPGEVPLKGGLLVAHYGKGYFVYTSLLFPHQLAAGVPGAYRLFANLVSLGK